MASPRQINVISLDFDGCIFNTKYFTSKSENRLFESNQDFIRSISKRIIAEKYHDVVFMVGSNRQDEFIDRMNGKKKAKDCPAIGSCFPALRELKGECVKQVQQLQGQNDNDDDLPVDDKVNLRIDGYLLADTYGKHKPGATYDALLANDVNFKHARYLFDKTKLTLLYAQMHKIASENPDAKIVFDFYDDRDDILSGLHEFFEDNRDLMPDNLILRMHKYAGEEIVDLKNIQGEGRIDRNYETNIWRMIECAKMDYEKFLQSLDTINVEPDVKKELLEADRLQTFKSQYENAFKKQEAARESIVKHARLLSGGSTSAWAFLFAFDEKGRDRKADTLFPGYSRFIP